MIGLIYLLVSYPPSFELRIGSYELGILNLFFTLVFLFLFSLIAYIFNNARRGMFAGVFVVIYLFLRLTKLTHPFFLVLIIALLVTIELFFSRKK